MYPKVSLASSTNIVHTLIHLSVITSTPLASLFMEWSILFCVYLGVFEYFSDRYKATSLKNTLSL